MVGCLGLAGLFWGVFHIGPLPLMIHLQMPLYKACVISTPTVSTWLWSPCHSRGQMEALNKPEGWNYSKNWWKSKGLGPQGVLKIVNRILCPKGQNRWASSKALLTIHRTRQEWRMRRLRMVTPIKSVSCSVPRPVPVLRSRAVTKEVPGYLSGRTVKKACLLYTMMISWDLPKR